MFNNVAAPLPTQPAHFLSWQTNLGSMIILFDLPPQSPEILQNKHRLTNYRGNTIRGCVPIRQQSGSEVLTETFSCDCVMSCG